jgi:hypothetical protein
MAAGSTVRFKGRASSCRTIPGRTAGRQRNAAFAQHEVKVAPRKVPVVVLDPVKWPKVIKNTPFIAPLT